MISRDVVTRSPGRRRGPRRLFAALVVGGLLVAGYVLLTLRPQQIPSYSLADDRTLILHVQAGILIWPHVSALTETPTSVTVTVSGIGVSVLTTESLTDVTVVLNQPLGDREVIDGSNALPVLRLAADFSASMLGSAQFGFTRGLPSGPCALLAHVCPWP